MASTQVVRDKVTAATGGRFPRNWVRGITWQAGRFHCETALNEFMRMVCGVDTGSKGGLHVGMSDREICELAQAMAQRCDEYALIYKTLPLMLDACTRLAGRYGIAPLDHERTDPLTGEITNRKGKMSPQGALLRYLDATRWRAWLRTAYNRMAEGVAVQLGIVQAKNNLYVTNESVTRRLQQNQRNAQALANTQLENELGQVFTLAELAALSVSNKSIKRCELMVRLAGFDILAQRAGHSGDFVTLTCPSRMHAVHRMSGEKNAAYDKTTPKEANDYLCELWKKIRAQFSKRGILVYGFRMAEPHHDACPHWHLVLFFDPQHRKQVRRLFLEYGLKDSRHEPGALRNRVKIKAIDFKKGSAAHYLAKYIAKNIDGYQVGSDLMGNDAITSSQRVEAWATTWKIRQFQQIGGAPVGVWRELRRVKELPADAPLCLQDAYAAVNYGKEATKEGKVSMLGKVGWALYTSANGGAVAKREARPIKLNRAWFDEPGKYGDPLGYKAAGVSAWGVVNIPAGQYGAPMLPHKYVVGSERYTWRVVGSKKSEDAQRLSPWIHVNNCNPSSDEKTESAAKFFEKCLEVPGIEWKHRPHDGYEGDLYDADGIAIGSFEASN